MLARGPLQNLVVKFFPEISPVLLCRVMDSWEFRAEVFAEVLCSEGPSKTRPKTS